jgi:DNA primase
LAQDVDLRILTLPENQDPADFLTTHGAVAFGRLVARAEEAWAYKLNRSASRLGVDSIDARQRVLDEMTATMAASPTLKGSARETALVRELAARLMTDERAVKQTLREARNQAAGRPASRPKPGADGERRRLVDFQNPDDVVECELLEMIFAVPTIVGRLQQEIGPAALRNEHLKSLLHLCFDLAEQGEDPSFDKVTAALEDAELKRLAARIDEHARHKHIARLLQDERPFTTNNGTRTTYADYVIGQIRLRCERLIHEPLKGRLTGLTTSPDASADTPPGVPSASPPDKAEQLRLLRQVQGYHARRANS